MIWGNLFVVEEINERLLFEYIGGLMKYEWYIIIVEIK